MATTIEHHVHEAEDSGISSFAIVVVVLAVLLLVGFILVRAGAFPFSGSADGTDVDVNIPGAENPIPDVNVNQN